jgi:hypothetical protein
MQSSNDQWPNAQQFHHLLFQCWFDFFCLTELHVGYRSITLGMLIDFSSDVIPRPIEIVSDLAASMPVSLVPSPQEANHRWLQARSLAFGLTSTFA